mgnify:CR=1 FL=1
MTSDMSEKSASDDAGEALAKINAELEAKIEELARANLELYETARQKSEFVANMSHELRTPLNSIIGFADVLLSDLADSSDPKQIKYLQNIRRSGYRLLEIISELMTFARIESGAARANTGPVSVPGLIAEVIAGLSRALTKRIDIVADAPDDMPTVMTDEIKLAQIITNLAANAVKFTPDGGTVTIAARIDGAKLIISVADTGAGIATEDQKNVFGRFRQLDTGAGRRYEGLGLGLYIVESLVRVLEGEISLSSEVGRGSTFVVSLPTEVLAL